MLSNPIGSKKLMQGVDTGDIVGAVAGIAAAGFIPGLVVKTATTTQQKWMKIGLTLLTTIALGMVTKKVMPSAAKTAVISGLVVTATQAINAFTNIKIGQATRPQIPMRNYPTQNYPNVGPSNISQTTKPEFQGIPTL